MTTRIARVGIVAKRGLRAASDHLEELASWLRQRGIEDFQLHYALQTITRLGRVQTAGSPRPRSR